MMVHGGRVREGRSLTGVEIKRVHPAKFFLGYTYITRRGPSQGTEPEYAKRGYTNTTYRVCRMRISLLSSHGVLAFR